MHRLVSQSVQDYPDGLQRMMGREMPARASEAVVSAQRSGAALIELISSLQLQRI